VISFIRFLAGWVKRSATRCSAAQKRYLMHHQRQLIGIVWFDGLRYALPILHKLINTDLGMGSWDIGINAAGLFSGLK
jgi:hypothetical protein